jgi:hypothetical protein
MATLRELAWRHFGDPIRQPLLAMAGAIPQDDSVARLPIPESTVKQLYGTATTCAYPTCNEPLL